MSVAPWSRFGGDNEFCLICDGRRFDITINIDKYINYEYKVH